MSDNITISEPLSLSLSDVKAHPEQAYEALLETFRQQERRIALLEENIGICFGIIAKLKARIEPEPSKTQADKGEVLRAILVANGYKMMAQDARKQLGMDKSSFSRLLSSMSQVITVKKFHANKRQNVIILNG